MNSIDMFILYDKDSLGRTELIILQDKIKFVK